MIDTKNINDSKAEGDLWKSGFDQNLYLPIIARETNGSNVRKHKFSCENSLDTGLFIDPTETLF